MLVFDLSIDGLEIDQKVYFIQDNKVKSGKVKSWGFTINDESVKVCIDVEHLVGFKESSYSIISEDEKPKRIFDDETKLQKNEYCIEGKLKDFDLYLTKEDLIESLLWEDC